MSTIISADIRLCRFASCVWSSSYREYMQAEGWYLDPFERFEQRWISDGTPTSLVRNGSVEAHDEPPTDTYTGDLTPAPIRDGSPDDLKRADDVVRNSRSITKGDIIEAGARVALNPFDGPL